MNLLLTGQNEPGRLRLLFQCATLRSACRILLALLLALSNAAAVAQNLKPADAGTTSGAKWRAADEVEESAFPRELALPAGPLLPDFRFAEAPASAEYTLFPLVLDQPDRGWRQDGAAASLALEETMESLGRGRRNSGSLRENSAGWMGLRTFRGAEDRLSRRSWRDKFRAIRISRVAGQRFYFGTGGELFRPTGPGPYPLIDYAWRGEREPWSSASSSFPKAIVRYGINEVVALKLDFERDVRLYQLSDDPFRVRNGFVRTDDFTPGLHLEYSAPGGWTLASGVRWYADPSFAVFDNNDEKPFLSDVRSGWSALVRISFDF